MAEDQDNSQRTEDPTQKRLDDALKRGDVVKSQEVTTWFIIAGGTLVLVAFSGGMGSGLTTTMRGLIANAHQLRVDGTGLIWLSEKIGLEVLAALAIPFVLLAVAAIAGNLVQHRLVWTTDVLAPKLNRISPLAGAKRLFSAQAIANFVKGLLKLVVIGAVLTVLLWPERQRAEGLALTDPAAILEVTKGLSLKLLGAVVAMLAVVAAADYLFQYRQWYERQKMTLRELKDEFKESEGDRYHHQPDPLRGGAEIRARHGGADLRRQGHRRGRAQDSRGRHRELGSNRGKPAARPRPARHRRNRAAHRPRALQGGGGGHQLRHAAARGGRGAALISLISVVVWPS
jgi:hypothetical protein